MKKSAHIILIFLTAASFLFAACKKDPLDQEKENLFNKLLGTWILTDYIYENYSHVGSGGYMSTYCSITKFENNIMTNTTITAQLDMGGWHRDTTIESHSYSAKLEFIEFKKFILYYKETITTDGNAVVTDKNADWTVSTRDSLRIAISFYSLKFDFDADGRLILADSSSYSGHNSGNSEVMRWTFTPQY